MGEALGLGFSRDTWHIRAACRGPQSAVFFPPAWPERRDDREARELHAKSICAQCEVHSECLDFALKLREAHGIWGGLTEGERRRILDQEPAPVS